jgi:hypothetical protein
MSALGLGSESKINFDVILSTRIVCPSQMIQRKERKGIAGEDSAVFGSSGALREPVVGDNPIYALSAER